MSQLQGSSSKTKSYYITLLSVAVCCCVFQFLIQSYVLEGKPVLKMGGDSYSYVAVKNNILNSFTFYDTKRLPAYPGFLAVTDIGGDWLVLILQRMMAVGCSLMIAAVAAKFFNKNWLTFLTGIFSYLYYDNFVYIDFKLTEVFTKFFFTLLCTVLITTDGNSRFIWTTICAFILCSTKTAFAPIFLVAVIILTIFRALPVYKGAILLTAACLTPFIFYLKTTEVSDGHESYLGYQAVSKVVPYENHWRLNSYPFEDKDIKALQEVLAESPPEELSGEWGMVNLNVPVRLSKKLQISENEAVLKISNIYFKTFMAGIFVRPHKTIYSFLKTLFVSMDKGRYADGSTLRKLSYCFRLSVQYLMGIIFIISPFACIILLFKSVFIIKGESKFGVMTVALAVIGFLMINYYAGGDGRYRVPVNDAMFITTIILCSMALNKFKLLSLEPDLEAEECQKE
ncbi:MAG: hypothetical protein ACYTFY_04130 [Planctomycetota bacterium]|jgi:hypothetical protein